MGRQTAPELGLAVSLTQLPQLAFDYHDKCLVYSSRKLGRGICFEALGGCDGHDPTRARFAAFDSAQPLSNHPLSIPNPGRILLSWGSVSRLGQVDELSTRMRGGG